MQRTQIYFEQQTLKELKKIASGLNVSVSELIRSVVKKELKKRHKNDMQTFIANMKPIESFADVDATEYVQSLREKSRILHD
ncbi:MAG: ribbon-helix-helix protein, CopG family [Sulfurovum sp.]|nr:ribbon-helix-helix protein, CopG family [Sulfurovum sp.]